MTRRPSKSFVYLMVALCPLLAALIFGLLPELPGFEVRPIPGEITFSNEKPATPKVKAVTEVVAKTAHPSEWFEEGYENLMKWEYNPWKTSKYDSFGGHYLKLLGSDAPADKAYCRQIERQVEAWYQKLLRRYPEMAVTMKTIPDEQNGFLKWLEFSEKMKAANPKVATGIDFPKELDDFLNHQGTWNAEAARNWLTEKKPLMDEIRAIGQMPDESVNGIAVERWAFMGARLAKNSVEGLILEARLAAEQGDASTALESIRTARGLADHFTGVETPTLLAATVQILIHLELEKFALAEIMPALPAGQLDPAAWEQALNPTVSAPSEFARYMKGEWTTTTRQYVLPMILDAEDPDVITDGGDYLDAHAAPFVETVRLYESAKLTDLPTLDLPMTADFNHLSRNARKLGEILFIGARSWNKGWNRSQSITAMTQAAFTIMKGQPVPQDPIYGQSYRWDPATRQLSMPAGEAFDQMDIKPITVPKP